MQRHGGARRWAVGVGAILGGLSVGLLKRWKPGQHTEIARRALVGAALIYPLAGRSERNSAIVTREMVALVAALALGASAARMPEARARVLTSAGWVAHAGFDALHDTADSWLPGWYRPLCVGFDGAVALMLLTGASDREGL